VAAAVRGAPVSCCEWCLCNLLERVCLYPEARTRSCFEWAHPEWLYLLRGSHEGNKRNDKYRINTQAVHYTWRPTVDFYSVEIAQLRGRRFRATC